MFVKTSFEGAVIALASFAVYSSHDAVIKVLGQHYSSVQIVFFAALLGFPLISLLLLRDPTDGNLRPKHPWWLLLRTICTVVTGVSCFYAFSVLPLAQTYAILFATPLMITLLAIPLLGERVGLRRGFAVLVGLLGVMVVLRPGSEPLAAGHVAALVSAISSALGAVIVRKISKDERPVVMLMLPMVANVLILAAVLPWVYVPMPLGHFALMAVVALLSLLGGLLIIVAYRRAEAAIVAPMQYSQIIWATIFGAAFFGESLDRYTGLGALIIIASGLYIVTRESTPNVSTHSPVLSTRTRPGSAAIAKSNLFHKVFDRRSDRAERGRVQE